MPGVNMKPDLIPSSVDAKYSTRRFEKKRICTLQGWRGYSTLRNIPSLTLIVHSYPLLRKPKPRAAFREIVGVVGDVLIMMVEKEKRSRRGWRSHYLPEKNIL